MNFVGGALKLKGLAKPVTISLKSKEIKKDKKHKKDADKKEPKHKVPLLESSSPLKEEKQESRKQVEEFLTPAQKQFREMQILRLKHKMEGRDAELLKSHRQKVENFNKKLANLPEHNDIPKVGPG